MNSRGEGWFSFARTVDKNWRWRGLIRFCDTRWTELWMGKSESPLDSRLIDRGGGVVHIKSRAIKELVSRFLRWWKVDGVNVPWRGCFWEFLKRAIKILIIENISVGKEKRIYILNWKEISYNFWFYFKCFIFDWIGVKLTLYIILNCIFLFVKMRY